MQRKAIKPVSAALFALGLLLGTGAQAQKADETSPAIAAKLDLRGSPKGIKVAEMRIQRKNDTLVVQADLQNVENKDRVVFHRFRWLDSVGNQVGDGEGWKQTTVLGLQTVTLKGVAQHPSAVDLKLEMSVESK
ncbi:YcfL family protein [Paucibacter sediminis]|uniref:YcfL family protein n=1 Tax=Paucibacter sediminis TaxID=3019553 RepID=A0AA95NBZ6_9BURK|nr:YcfL family protein [Paucibacter sp. S2-9]WIT12237.1 YcfL family protein [Paucibacter sp. S2-9]